jgi:hypothetical protein
LGFLYFIQQCLNAVQVSCFYALLFPGEYRDMASFGVLTFPLIVRPSGLFNPVMRPEDRV